MLITCPTCRSGLQVPDGTTAMVRCPSCKNVFSASTSAPAPPPEPPEEREYVPEEFDQETLTITCPACASGLQVPRGTTAMIRCPNCKNVFSPSLPVPVPPEPPEEREYVPEEFDNRPVDVVCPTCGSGLQVPPGTTAMIRCPACKNVFSPSSLPPEPQDEEEPEEEEEEELEEEEPDKPLSIICPTCRSGLQVPPGTNMVRCPACKSVFAAANALAPPPPAEDRKARPPRGKTRKAPPLKARPDEEDEEKPRTKKAGKKDEKEEKPENRDFDPPDPDAKPKKRKKLFDTEMSEEERLALKAAFIRATWGCKLVWSSFLLFMFSMLSIIVYFFQMSFGHVNSSFLYLAGALGVINWLLGAIGVGLCLSGPPSRGHWGYGIAAAIATGIHLLMVLMLIAPPKDKERENASTKSSNNSLELDPQAYRWSMLATREDMITLYLASIFYGEDQDVVPKFILGFYVAVGITEITRNILIMMLLSCLAQAGGDEELSRACTRAAGTSSLAPGTLSVLMLIYVAFVTETNATGLVIRILNAAIVMGIYALLAGCMLRASMAARETADVCEEPYQSQQPLLL